MTAQIPNHDLIEKIVDYLRHTNKSLFLERSTFFQITQTSTSSCIEDLSQPFGPDVNVMPTDQGFRVALIDDSDLNPGHLGFSSLYNTLDNFDFNRQQERLSLSTVTRCFRQIHGLTGLIDHLVQLLKTLPPLYCDNSEGTYSFPYQAEVTSLVDLLDGTREHGTNQEVMTYLTMNKESLVQLAEFIRHVDGDAQADFRMQEEFNGMNTQDVTPAKLLGLKKVTAEIDTILSFIIQDIPDKDVSNAQ